MTGGLNLPAIDNTLPVMERSSINLEDTSTHRPSTPEKEPQQNTARDNQNLQCAVYDALSHRNSPLNHD